MTQSTSAHSLSLVVYDKDSIVFYNKVSSNVSVPNKPTSLHDMDHKVLTHSEQALPDVECDKSLNSKNIPAVDPKMHTYGKPFSCNLCHRSYTLKKNLQYHLKTHTSERRFFCDVCGKGFFQKCHLVYHSELHAEKRPFSCDICNKGFTRRDKLVLHSKTHMSKQHLKPKSLVRYHEAVTHNEQILPDAECDKNLNSKDIPAVNQELHTNEQLFSCHLCPRSYKQKTNLQYHLKTHTKERRFSCDVCGKGFFQNCHLELHSRIHTGERPFSCDICKESFISSSSLVNHSRKHMGKQHLINVSTPKQPSSLLDMDNETVTHNEQPLHDDIDESSDSKDNLAVNPRMHMDLQHFIFNSSAPKKPSSLLDMDHETVTHNEQTLHDDIDESSDSKDNLAVNPRMHMDLQHLICNVSAPKKPSSLLDMDHETVTHNEQTLHDDIDESSDSKDNLAVNPRMHMDLQHFIFNSSAPKKPNSLLDMDHETVASNEQTLPYDIDTNSVFKNKPESNPNVSTHEQTFSCNLCPRSYTLKKNLKYHLKTHTGERPFSCEVCGKGFFQRCHLELHSVIHTGERPFSCDICKESFSRKRSLVKHSRIHMVEKHLICNVSAPEKNSLLEMDQNTVNHNEQAMPDDIDTSSNSKNEPESNTKVRTHERPFSCNLCNRSYTQKKNLQYHVKTHANERRFFCDVCGKGFFQNCHLVIHSRLHTGERPFSCEVCGKGFTDTSALAKHSKLHKLDQLHTCDVCDKSYSHKSSLVKHLRIHNEEAPPPRFNCDVCDKEYSEKGSLLRHKITHVVKKSLICRMCNKIFSNAGDLFDHMNQHLDEDKNNFDKKKSRVEPNESPFVFVDVSKTEPIDIKKETLTDDFNSDYYSGD